MSLADELITRGWTQGRHEDAEGRVCLSGAVSYELANSSDHHVIDTDAWFTYLTVLKSVAGQEATSWNDALDRTFDEVLRVAKEADEMIDYLKELNASSQSSADRITGES